MPTPTHHLPGVADAPVRTKPLVRRGIQVEDAVLSGDVATRALDSVRAGAGPNKHPRRDPLEKSATSSRALQPHGVGPTALRRSNQPPPCRLLLLLA